MTASKVAEKPCLKKKDLIKLNCSLEEGPLKTPQVRSRAAELHRGNFPNVYMDIDSNVTKEEELRMSMMKMEEKVGIYVASFCATCIMLESYLTSVFGPIHLEINVAVLMGPHAKDRGGV